MTTHSQYARIIRRETHSPRAGLAIVLAIVLVLACAYAVVEIILALVAQPALLVSPRTALAAVLDLPTAVTSPALITIGVIVAVIGILLIVHAILPGRRGNHVGAVERTAMVVDDRVVASTIARRASRAGKVDPDQVVVTIGHRTAEVRVRPTSGWFVDTAAIDAAVRDEIAGLNLTPALSHKVVVEKTGTVGA
ncbi:DUF6286 domain-containing protein [Glaciihabitans sp. dw_435]|uniref:DUF6286 domain-containing protein n=1 Tax=Glaciihabitans sp. dw_435 TaxID=2720081 RepID=UPI001BD269A5|nr:DUF6286 domain-containing protein [Glaciihabitans sp. dw_435]